ncbi:hypothetical protein PISMIDRAFT_114975 [Pisolithus microcarpus 441]|uniref:Uncharacterized protein n=1 Tax=Pisolithus microcarpus 441 TaxID=765257 RepID=A0A0C9XTA8_9AGAM|nr:hypothetical protein PISMIDRAFT_114975 [Pisolithus microcarpus 441]
MQTHISIPGCNNKHQQLLKWQVVIPTLVDTFLSYLTWTMSKPLPTPPSTLSHCVRACKTKTSVIVCLYFNHMCISLVFRSN